MTSSDTSSPPAESKRPTEAFPTVGILGGGQLARMMTEAAIRLGIRTRIYQAKDEGPASASPVVHHGTWSDHAALRDFLSECDVVTLDNEWVDLTTVREEIPQSAKLLPSARTMRLIGDKIEQKEHAQRSGLPIGPMRTCASLADVESAAAALGFPMVLKRPTQSYDGYGNQTVRDSDQLRAAYEALAQDGRILVEAWVPFEQELAVIVARRPGGECVTYPVATTVQRDHRCEAVEVPAGITPQTRAAATELARRAAEAYDCVGAVGVELFLLKDGSLLLNELAPRPHNTGHYTIDACVTSQFENHLRAVLDLPLGDPSLLRPAVVMVNVLGNRSGVSSPKSLRAALAVPSTCVHIYDKREVRPGRKMAHVTAMHDTVDEAKARAYEAAQKLDL